MPPSSDRLQRPSEPARLDDVSAWIDGWAAPLEAEELPLLRAAGRMLARGVDAPLDLPPHDRAAADGFALKAEETVGASAYNPLSFTLQPASAGVVSGAAAAVASGEPLPAGADAVVRLEHAMPEPPAALAVIGPVFVGSDVERQGSHVARGGPLLRASSRRLDAADLGLLAEAGLGRVSVVRSPRVKLLLAADPLIEIGQAPAPGQAFEAGGTMLSALITRDGGEIVERRRVGRAKTEMQEALLNALEAPRADVVLVAGGTGPGRNDHAAAALAEVGTLAVHGVALQPGATASAGRIDGMPVFLLPGPPAHCLWAYELVAGRAVRLMAGRGPEPPYTTATRRIARKIVSEVGTVEVWPVRCVSDAEVEPLPSLAEAGLAAAAKADGFILVPEGSEGYPQGAAVTVYLRR